MPSTLVLLRHELNKKCLIVELRKISELKHLGALGENRISPNKKGPLHLQGPFREIAHLEA
jgi:hypothetical protein